MPDYILLMRDDVPVLDAAWEPYLQRLRETGRFQGGSAIGNGVCVRKDGRHVRVTRSLVGYLRVEAASFEDAKALLAGNPHLEAGGTVEIRELPRSGE